MTPTAHSAAGPAARPHSLRAAVIGSPIGHSRSPALHRAAYDLLGFDCSYEAVDVTPEDLPAFVAGVRSSGNWRGLSVTMPHKTAMVDLVDSVTSLAGVLGVLNTVTVDASGPEAVLTGHNTDVAGIVGALRHGGVLEAPRSAVILGGGGTAAASLAALQLLGATGVTVFVRSLGRAAPLSVLGETLGLQVQLREWDGAAAGLLAADVVISTLPPGGADALAGSLVNLPVPREHHPQPVLLDVAYDPWPSPLAAAWEARDGAIVPGLEMLIYQAVEQVRLFTGSDFRDPALVLKVMCDAVGAPAR
ncbi:MULTISPECIES: shikimate dehydrogenase [unclassified Arthrobacter]|uniref:shikimate dehydrogenase n=1 Tax=unclassified Arthrobacter TaxID=235627 RepID=UPI001490D4DB|nr:shikimate dehydrogenase [Arthrobacter sp. AET 35A]MBE0009836.1 shikimate dehydrogenase [Arthrobacter sp. AET 35A]NOJ63664.1 shikimate dehydrogenase [Arthrobacter sp. 147(2020)]